MKLEAHPLIVAAALGFLGPAALADDDDGQSGLAGIWSRVSQARSGAASTSLAVGLGAELEVIPMEDRLILDDGGDAGAGQTWSLADDGGARLELDVGGARVVRELKQDGDALQVRTVIDDAGERTVLLDCYTRSVYG